MKDRCKYIKYGAKSQSFTLRTVCRKATQIQILQSSSIDQTAFKNERDFLEISSFNIAMGSFEKPHISKYASALL